MTLAAPVVDEVVAEAPEPEVKPPNDVLVVSIYPPADCPGMMSEKKVISVQVC